MMASPDPEKLIEITEEPPIIVGQDFDLLSKMIAENSELREKNEILRSQLDSASSEHHKVTSSLKEELKNALSHNRQLQTKIENELKIYSNCNQTLEENLMLTKTLLQTEREQLRINREEYNKLCRKNEALEKALRLINDEKEKLFADNVYLDELVENLQCKIKDLEERLRIKNISTDVGIQTNHLKTENSLNNCLQDCDNCDRLAFLVGEYVHLYGKLHLDCDVEESVPWMQYPKASRIRQRIRGENNNSTCAVQFTQTVHKSIQEPIQLKNYRNTASHLLPAVSPEAPAAYVVQSDLKNSILLNTPKSEKPDSVLSEMNLQGKPNSYYKIRLHALCKALRKKTATCRTLETDKCKLESRLIYARSRIRALQKLNQHRVSNSRPEQRSQNLLRVKESAGSNYRGPSSTCGILHHKLMQLTKQNASLRAQVEKYSLLLKQNKSPHVAFLRSQRSDLEPNFRKIDTLCEQSIEDELKDSMWPTELTVDNDSPGRFTAPSPEREINENKMNDVDQSADAEIESVSSYEKTELEPASPEILNPIVLLRQRNKALIQQIRVAHEAKLLAENQALSQTTKAEKLSTLLHKSQHEVERYKRIVEQLTGYMHQLDQLLRDSDQSDSTNDAKIKSDPGAATVFDVGVIQQPRLYAFARSLAQRVQEVLDKKISESVVQDTKIRDLSREESRHRLILSELRRSLGQAREQQQLLKSELDLRNEALTEARLTESHLRTEIKCQQTRIKALLTEKHKLVDRLEELYKAYNTTQEQFDQLNRKLLEVGLQKINMRDEVNSHEMFERKTYMLQGNLAELVERLTELGLRLISDIRSHQRSQHNKSIDVDLPNVSDASLSLAKIKAAELLGLSVEQLSHLCELDHYTEKDASLKLNGQRQIDWALKLEELSQTVNEWPLIFEQTLYKQNGDSDLREQIGKTFCCVHELLDL